MDGRTQLDMCGGRGGEEAPVRKSNPTPVATAFCVLVAAGRTKTGEGPRGAAVGSSAGSRTVSMLPARSCT